MNQEINKRFKQIRQELNLSQDEYAKKLDVMQGTVSDIERERIGVSKKMVRKLVEKLNVSELWLRAGEGTVFNIGNYNSLQGESAGLDAGFWKNDPKPFINLKAIENQSDITLNLSHLDQIIKNQLFLIEFYGIDILYHMFHSGYSKESGDKQERKLTKLRMFVAQHEGEAFLGEKPAYTELDANEKVELIKELTEALRIILDSIWEISRNISHANPK